MEELTEVSINDKFLVSLHVNSLFTNILLNETIKIAVDLIKTSYTSLKISSDNLTKLFKYATYEAHFLFNGKRYDQVAGRRCSYAISSTNSFSQSFHRT